jgi:S1-C subfamily serine protease
VAGAPVLHFFTGGHLQYHRSTDDAALINAGGLARVAAIVADVAAGLASRAAPLTYLKAAAPATSGGDRRTLGASLGTVPSYGGDPSAPPGMVLADVVPGGAAATAGLKAGDRIIKLGDVDVRSVEDLMFVLMSARPGQRVTVTFVRGGQRQTAEATYGTPRAR